MPSFNHQKKSFKLLIRSPSCEDFIGISRFALVMVKGNLRQNCITGPMDSGSGGFFLTCEDLGRMFDHSFPFSCAFFFFLFFFFEVKIRSHTLIPLSMQGPVHSGSASCSG